MSLSSVFTSRSVAIAVLTVSLLAVANAIAGPGLIAIGLLVAGPCLAAVSANPRAVVAVGAYTLVLVLALTHWPYDLWWTVHQLVYVAGVVTITSVSVFAASRHRDLQAAAEQGDAGRRQLAAIVEFSDDAIITKTLDGIITSWNPGASRMYGYRPDEAIGQSISIIVGPVEAGDLAGIMARLRRGEHIDHFETQRFCKDGTVKDVSVTMSPMRDGAGQVTGASAVARDISGRKQAEIHQHQVQEASQQSQRLQSLGQLAGGIAHDFNNLLAVIGNYADFVAEQTTEDSSVQADIAAIRRATDRAAGLTRQLLVFARGEPQRATTFDLNAAVAEAQQLLARIIGEHIDLVTKVADEPLMIHADRGQVQQVLLNLVVNARDAMPDGGTLVIETSCTELDATLTDPQLALPAGGYARLVVSDTGSGMTPEVVAHIFEPFFSTKPRDRATGLGLATVHGVVAQAGGDIGVYTEPHLGTTMRVYLPTTSRTGAGSPDEPAAQPPRGQGQTILVVEDEDAIRHMVVRILAGHGFIALNASRGAYALTLAGEHRCDLVITDVVMPEMSGPQLAAQMRARHPLVPVLFMSGYSDGLLGDGSSIGGAELMQKPFTASELLGRVDAILTRAAAEAAKPAG